MSVIDKFLKYVKISSPSDEKSSSCPSSKGQLEMAEYLVQQLKEIDVENVRCKDGYVYGEVSATKGYENKPVIGFIAHMDTAIDFNGYDIKPQIIENYDGEDVVLKATGDILSPSVFPQLKSFKGNTLITTDGTSLLGADDKAGIAIIVQALQEIIKENKNHCKVVVAFTPDEEIGRGADLFDVKGFGADFAYTVDGSLPGEIEYENFNAVNAKVIINGFSIHPGRAKGKMINSQRVAFEFDAMLPEFERPEHTEGFEGFYHLTDIYGNTEKTVMEYILRDHCDDKIKQKEKLLYEVAQYLNSKYGKDIVKVETQLSYRNMKQKILPHFHIVENAKKAIMKEGITPKSMAIRGGTDGARLSFMGLPCPNIATGGMNFHGKYECITKENMEVSVRIVKNIIDIYSM